LYYTGQETEEKPIDNHALSGIRTHVPSVLAGDDISCLKRAVIERKTSKINIAFEHRAAWNVQSYYSQIS
jgi:hypothetical protein